MGFMTQEEINVGLFDECKRLRADLARVTAERDRWQRLAQNESASAELSGLAATDHGAARSQMEAENDRLRLELRYIDNCPPPQFSPEGHDREWYERLIRDMQKAARAALNGEGEG